MHNNIMAAGSKDRPPMLGPGRYSQWRSRFLRYIDTKPNGEGLRKSILSGPYVPSTVLVQAVAAMEGNPAIQQHTTIETVLNMTPENKEHFLSEKEAIFLLLTGIGDDIYSTVDAFLLLEMENLYGVESYYSWFYKLMNELTRNNFQVTTMKVNVQFLQQLQPEWSRFVTVVKQSKEIDTISYHTLFDILKQYQNEVNDIRAERIAKRHKEMRSPTSYTQSDRPCLDEDSDPEKAQLVPSCFVIFDLEPLSLSFDFIQRISLTGFPAQSIGSSNTDVLDLPCLLGLITGTSQSRQHGKSESDSYYLSDYVVNSFTGPNRYPVDTSLIHIESRKSPTKSFVFDAG
ncbi:hypothetical protein Tco_0588041 [Tanacetum coccineum]